MRHGQGSDSPLLRDIDELREFCEAVLAKEPGREVVEAAGGASGSEHLPFVSQGNEEPLPRHPGGPPGWRGSGSSLPCETKGRCSLPDAPPAASTTSRPGSFARTASQNSRSSSMSRKRGESLP